MMFPSLLVKRFLGFSIAGLCLVLASSPTTASDKITSAIWLNAIGTLRVPGSRIVGGYATHHVEDCTATLVTLPNKKQANTIVTAWHCLELYSDLTRTITFTLRSQSGLPVTLEAYPLADGGSMLADWAVLRISQSIRLDHIEPIPMHLDRANPLKPIIMAGFSRGNPQDNGTGLSANTLPAVQAKGFARPFHIDTDCKITQQHRSTTDTDCMAQKGASGGPVIQLGASGNPYFCGVISQGDGAGFSSYVPVDRFRNTIKPLLR